jgi:type I restriction enzyme S subunit
MNRDWEVVPLKDLCEDFKKDIVDGPFGSNLKREHFTSSGVPVLKIQNIKPYEIILKNMDFVSDEKAAELQRHSYKTGDIIITKLGLPLGSSAIVEDIDDGIIVADLVRVRALKVDTRYLCYHLNSTITSDYLNSQSGGATRPRVKISAVRELPIFKPPLPEQKRIVTILDEVFAGITQATANAGKNLANARELFESYLNSVFSQKGEGWIEKQVGEIADHCLGKMLDKKKNKGFLKPYLRNLNVRWFDFDLNDLLKMRFEEGEEDRYSALKGDLLICEGGYPGRAAIWQNDEPIFFQKAIHRVRFKEPLHNRWLMYFLYLSNATGNLRQYFTGAGIQHFTGQALKRFQLPVAPLSEISLHLTKFDLLFKETKRLETIYQKKLAALAELKQSILQKAFTGELTADIGNQQLVN